MQNIERKPLGVIDALSSGFALVVRQPWVLLVPVAFNLFLWLGPQVNARPLFDQLIAQLNALAATTPNITPETQQGLDASKDMLKSLGDSFNVLNITALFALGVPALLGLETVSPDSPSAPWLLVVDIGTLMGLSILLALIGVFIASVYLEMIARVVRRDATVRTFALRVLKSYLNTGLLMALACVGLLILLSPFLIGATLVSLLSQGLASFILIAGFMLTLWAFLYLASRCQPFS